MFAPYQVTMTSSVVSITVDISNLFVGCFFVGLVQPWRCCQETKYKFNVHTTLGITLNFHSMVDNVILFVVFLFSSPNLTTYHGNHYL